MTNICLFIHLPSRTFCKPLVSNIETESVQHKTSAAKTLRHRIAHICFVFAQLHGSGPKTPLPLDLGWDLASEKVQTAWIASKPSSQLPWASYLYGIQCRLIQAAEQEYGDIILRISKHAYPITLEITGGREAALSGI